MANKAFNHAFVSHIFYTIRSLADNVGTFEERKEKLERATQDLLQSIPPEMEGSDYLELAEHVRGFVMNMIYQPEMVEGFLDQGIL